MRDKIIYLLRDKYPLLISKLYLNFEVFIPKYLNELCTRIFRSRNQGVCQFNVDLTHVLIILKLLSGLGSTASG